jgi:tRNA-2-methylthio-N6-dimethylallyladenosine synthase
LDKLCPHIHLPVQSGSDALLDRMNRRYTRAHYLDIVRQLRDSCPQIAVTTDIIVGFPGETRADFEATLDLMRQVQFDSLFAFMYSDRPKAPSTQLPDKVPLSEKRERLQELLRVQDGITRRKHAALVGTVQDVLVEGPSKRPGSDAGSDGSSAQWTGRTPGNRVVNFHVEVGPAGGGDIRPGHVVPVRIERGLAHSLRGVAAGPGTGRPEREADHAA